MNAVAFQGRPTTVFLSLLLIIIMYSTANPTTLLPSTICFTIVGSKQVLRTISAQSVQWTGVCRFFETVPTLHKLHEFNIKVIFFCRMCYLLKFNKFIISLIWVWGGGTRKALYIISGHYFTTTNLVMFSSNQNSREKYLLFLISLCCATALTMIKDALGLLSVI